MDRLHLFQYCTHVVAVQEEEGFLLHVNRTKDWRFISLTSVAKNSTEVHLMSAELPHSSPVLIAARQPGELQCFLFSRILGYLTPKIIYFYYLKKYFLDQSIQKNILFNFEKGRTGELQIISA